MITVGFGDFVATNLYEVWYSIVAMLVGAIVFGYVIGTVGVCFASITASTMRHNARLGEMVAYLKHNKVPTSLFTKACLQYDYYLKRKSAFDEDLILGELTESLRQEVGTWGPWGLGGDGGWGGVGWGGVVKAWGSRWCAG
jgi:hypothetical protein